jgi:hypothetical protein
VSTFLNPFENVGKMIGPLMKTSDFCRGIFIFVTTEKKAKKETTFRSRNAPFILSRAHSSNRQILLRYRVVFVFGVARKLEEH